MVFPVLATCSKQVSALGNLVCILMLRRQLFTFAHCIILLRIVNHAREEASFANCEADA